VKAMNLTTKRWQQLGIIILLLTLLETHSWASTNAAAGSPPATEANRVLLILETSKNMQRQGDAALAAINELFGSGMHGQMRSGDTVGLWTYNDELYVGHLPVQDWTPKNAKDVQERTLKFITQQKLENKGDLKKVLPRMARVLNDSEFITVILVNTGEDEIAGTPYDREINEYYKTWRKKQPKAVKPFVTVLRGERGKLTHYSVCQVPWKIEIPAVPPEREAAQLAQHKPAPAPVKKAPPPMGKPLIVTGGSRRTDSVDGTKTAPVAIPLPQPRFGEVLKDPRLETAEEIVARLLAEAGQPREITPPLKVISSHGSTSGAANSISTSGTNANLAAVSRPQAPLADVTPSSTNAAAIVNTEPVLPKPEPVKTTTIAVADTLSRSSESPAATEKIASATPPESFLHRKPIQRAGMALAAGALTCLFIGLRRPKSAYQGSIITRSLERESR
jgi:hypothetical protein